MDAGHQALVSLQNIMENFETIIFILAILIGLSAVADKIKLPYPILLVAVGLLIGFIPVLPNLSLNPDIVFLIFLPPLLYDAAAKTSWQEFKTSIRPISTLAITLVFFTTTAVAIAAHYFIPGFSWPLAFVLGAIVSPPDAVAAASITQGLGLNKRVIAILEGESLVNDASALIAYRYAVAAVTTGTFVFWEAGLQFLLVAGGGLLIGLVTGYLFAAAFKRIDDAVVETSLTLLAPFVAYLAAEHVEASGVLAVVSAGLFITWRAPEVFSYQSRIQSRAVWNTVIFLLNGFVFIIIGLQLPAIVRDLNTYTFWQLVSYGTVISVTTIVIRILWVFISASYQNIFRRVRRTGSTLPDSPPVETPWKSVVIIAWTGTRGVVSLATALALPLTLRGGTLFPNRPLILFLAFVVIFATLVLQGLTLPLLIKLLNVKPQDTQKQEEKELQLFLATQVFNFVEHDFPMTLDVRLRSQLKRRYEAMISMLTNEIQDNSRKQPVREQTFPLSQLLNAQNEIANFQQELLIKLRREGRFTDDIIRDAEHVLDFDKARIDTLLVKLEE